MRSSGLRIGAVALLIAPVQFVVAMAVTQLGWTTPYSLLANYISDLGAVSCGDFPAGSARYVCSPWHLVFDVSIVVLGLLTIFAAYLIRPALPRRGDATVGLLLLAASGVGAMGVGLSPEDVNLTVHTLSAFASFVGANVALVGLGWSGRADPRWGRAFAAFSVVLGVVGLVALLLFSTGHYVGLRVGGMERVIVAPVLLWSAVAGLRILRFPEAAFPRVPEAAALA